MGNFDALDRLLRRFPEAGPAGCACAAAREGKTLYEGYYGLADVEAGRQVAEDTVFRLFSMTKVVVCAAALILFERGRFLLNEPLAEYLPEFAGPTVYRRSPNGGLSVEKAKNPLLVKHAFTMSMGLPYAFGQSETAKDLKRVQDELDRTRGRYTLGEHLKEIARVPLAFEPGTQWLYGYGHDVVAGLIEAVSGKTVGQFLEDEVFGPLGMASTGYRWHGGIESRVATVYERKPDGSLARGVGFLDHNHAPDALYEGGGAGLYATVGDYLKFSQMMANGGASGGVRILGRKTIDLMRRNHLDDAQLSDFRNSYLAGYGYGLGVRTMMDPAAGHSNTSVGEFGWTGALGTWVSIDPSEGFSVVYMHQTMPNMEEYHHLRVRTAAYSGL